jgi:translation initiation factor 4G
MDIEGGQGGPGMGGVNGNMNMPPGAHGGGPGPNGGMPFPPSYGNDGYMMSQHFYPYNPMQMPPQMMLGRPGVPGIPGGGGGGGGPGAVPVPRPAVREKKVLKIVNPNDNSEVKIEPIAATPTAASTSEPPPAAAAPAATSTTDNNNNNSSNNADNAGVSDAAASGDAAAPASASEPASDSADAKQHSTDSNNETAAAPAAAAAEPEPPAKPELLTYPVPGVVYPDDFNPELRRYTREFMLQFKDKCTAKPEFLTDPKEVLVGTGPSEPPPRSVGRTNSGMSGSSPLLGANRMPGMPGGPGSQGSGGFGSMGRGGFGPQSGPHPHAMGGGMHRGGMVSQPMRGGRGGYELHQRGGGGGAGGRRGNQKGQMNFPPLTPAQQAEALASLKRREDRWVIQNKAQMEANEIIFRSVKAILNKMTVEKFDRLSQQLLDVGITSAAILRGVIALIFDKALNEPTFAPMYAMMCSKLNTKFPEFTDEPPPPPPTAEGEEPLPPPVAKPETFRRILLNLCQEEFENKLDREALAKMDKEAAAAEDLKMRRRMLGNIKFIGELYLHNMLTEKIMHQCISKLLADICNFRADSGDSDAFFDNIEALCKLFTTIGKKLESTKATQINNQYFDKMRALTETEMPSRYKFMLKDVIDLRAASWEPRRKEAKAKTIDEIRAEAQREVAMGPNAQPGSGSRPGGGGGGGKYPAQQQQGQQGQQRPQSGQRGNANQKSDDWQQTSGARKGGAQQQQHQQHQQHQQQQQQGQQQQQRTQIQQRGGGGAGQRGGRDDGGNASGRPSGNPFDSLQVDSPELGSQPSPPLPTSSSADLRRLSSSESAAAAASKKAKEDPMSPAVLEKKVASILAEYQSIKDLAEATLCVKDLKAPQYHADIVTQAVNMSLEGRIDEAPSTASLLSHLHREDVLTNQQIKDGLVAVIETLSDVMIDAPLAGKIFALIVGNLIAAGALSVLWLEKGLEPLVASRQAGDLAASIFEAVEVEEPDDPTYLARAVAEGAGLNFAVFLDPEERESDDVYTFLENRNLLHVYPLLNFFKDLRASLEAEDIATVTALINDSEHRDDPQFVPQLVTLVLEVLTSKTIFAQEATETKESAEKKIVCPTKETQNRELELMVSYRDFLIMAIPVERQLDALFAVQKYVLKIDFPAGFMERLFHHLYHLDIIDEDAFLLWKDTINDVPGKTLSLFQVNRFITWLQEAESESGGEEEGGEEGEGGEGGEGAEGGEEGEGAEGEAQEAQADE